MKILHLAPDEKFIDHAALVFEKAFPEKNDFIIFSNTNNLQYVKLKPKKIIINNTRLIKKPILKPNQYTDYNLVIFHSFSGLCYEIFNIPEELPTIWFGFGFDYYDLICKKNDLLLRKTHSLAIKNLKSYYRTKISKFLRFTFDFIGLTKSRKEAIEKLTIFAPVLPNEYKLVGNAKKWTNFPKYGDWNYGTIEDHLIKGFENEQVNGDAILVGNSASITCNHIETFDFIQKKIAEKRTIVAPLSYGDKKYTQIISTIGKKYFGNNFDPLMNFMPIQDYVSKIKKCGYVIMNHKRQQAVGNIIIMLYLGARVFLREENPTYQFLKNMGISFSSVQELEKNISLLNTPLTNEEKNNNKELVSIYWARERSIHRTKVLIQKALKYKAAECKDNFFQGSTL